MPGRRRRARCIAFDPGYLCFKPCGRPGRGLETVELRADELEALRLSHLEGLYQEACARRMQISRTTLSRTLAEAHRKVVDALIHGKRLVIAASPADSEMEEQERWAAPIDHDDRLALVPGVEGAKPPDEQDARRPLDHSTQEDPGMKKIVLTANDDRGLSGEMARHFGHCPYFAVVHVREGQGVEWAGVHANPYAESHEPGQIPHYIKSLGADVVIAGGMGGKAIDWFRGLGIEVVTGVRQDVGATLDAYLAGALNGAAECRHDD